MLYFDRTYSGFTHYIISERKAHVRNRGGEILLRLMIDRFSVEIFVNDGDAVFTSRIFPTEDEHHWALEGDCSIRIWKLKAAVEDSFVV
jgi:beta-fructofuranosidase